MQQPNNLATIRFNPFDVLNDPITDALYRGWVRQYAKVYQDADPEYPYGPCWQYSPEWLAWSDYWNGERGAALPDAAMWLIDQYGMKAYNRGCEQCSGVYAHHPDCPNETH